MSLQMTRVLSLGSLSPEFYTVQHLIVAGAAMFSKRCYVESLFSLSLRDETSKGRERLLPFNASLIIKI